MTRLLVFGSGGQLGFELMRAGLPDGLERTGLDRNVLDVTDSDAVASGVRNYNPDVVVNAAAYTDVDGAEDDREAAFAVNARAPGRMAPAEGLFPRGSRSRAGGRYHITNPEHQEG